MRQLALLAGKRRLKGPVPELAQKAATLSQEFGFINPIPMVRVPNAGRAGSDVTHWAKLLWRLNTSFVPADVASNDFKTVKWEGISQE